MKVNRNKYFSDLIASTTFEEIEDKLQNKTSIEVSSISEKVAKGKCWYPTRVLNVFSVQQKKCTLRIKRADIDELKHNFNIGSTVQISNNKLYSNQKKTIQGRVTKINQSIMHIKVSYKDYKEYEEKDSWLDKDDLVIEAVYNRKGYKRMKKILRKIQNNPDKLTKIISNALIGNSDILNNEKTTTKRDYNLEIIKKLNSSQKKAICDILTQKNVSLILGPPGTGKTTTIVHAIKIIVEAGLKDKKILVTAPSNTAVDLLATRLQTIGNIEVLRLGNTKKFSPEANQVSLSEKMKNHFDFPLLNGISKSIQKQYHYIRSNKIARKEKSAIKKSIKKNISVRNRLFKQITRDVFKNTQVIACTLEGTLSQDLKKFYKSKFEYTFIDEAGQALEPLTWLPVIKTKKVVLIGDHHQLPPVVKSVERYDLDLKKSLFEKAMTNGNISYNLLSVQYRMHEKIMNFSNQYFYKKQLQAHENNRFWTISKHKKGERWNAPFEFIDTSNCDFKEVQLKDVSTRSTVNEAEGKFLISHLENLITQLKKECTFEQRSALSIGIITPYREQLYHLEKLVNSSPKTQNFIGQVSVNTVDGFQGQEKDVIYISLVRSNPTHTIGFLKEYRRMNVALTRARKKVVIIGDTKTISRDSFYKSLIQYAKEKGTFIDAFELLQTEELSSSMS